MTTHNVAGDLCGVWQRRLLSTGSRLDTRSLVIYLQTPNFAADLRLPADRPPLGGAALADYDPQALGALLGQEGFVARFFRDGARVRWERLIDLSPLPGPDESWMEMSGDLAIEYGMHSDFVEHWWRREAADAPYLVLRGAGEPWRWLLRVGSHFIAVRDRRPAPDGRPLRAAYESAQSAPARRQVLDCEVSWGRWQPAGAPRIEASTLPFREGRTLDPAARASADGIIWAEEAWEFVESSFDSPAAACRWLSGAAPD